MPLFPEPNPRWPHLYSKSSDLNFLIPTTGSLLFLSFHKEGDSKPKEEIGAQQVVRLDPSSHQNPKQHRGCPRGLVFSFPKFTRILFFSFFLFFFFFFFLLFQPVRTGSPHPHSNTSSSNITEKTDKRKKHLLMGSQKESVGLNFRAILLSVPQAQLTARLPGATGPAKSGGETNQPCGLYYHFSAF